MYVFQKSRLDKVPQNKAIFCKIVYSIFIQVM